VRRSWNWITGEIDSRSRVRSKHPAIALNSVYSFVLLSAIVSAAALLNASPVVACSSFDERPCAPRLSRLFHHRHFGPDLYVGEDLRLTIYSGADQSKPNEAAALHPLDRVGDLFAALRGCWTPPPEDRAHAGMEMTVRFALKRNGELIAPPRLTYASRGVPTDLYFTAIMDSLHRCSPLPLTQGLGSEIAGVPIAVRFVDDRKLR
jgi:hypothetical protein